MKRQISNHARWVVVAVLAATPCACRTSLLPDGGEPDAAGADAAPPPDATSMVSTPNDFALPMCTAAPQASNGPAGSTPLGDFQTQGAVAGWSWGEGACNGQPTVWLLGSATVPMNVSDVVDGIRIFDPTSRWVDAGTTHDVIVSHHLNGKDANTTGQVTWLRQDDFMQPGGVLEGFIIVDTPGWAIKGKFTANRCNRLDELCI